MFKWLFHIFTFATNVGNGKYQNKEKSLKRQRKLGLVLTVQKGMTGQCGSLKKEVTNLLFKTNFIFNKVSTLTVSRVSMFIAFLLTTSYHPDDLA